MYWNIGDHMQLDYELQYALIASGAAVICTMGATLFSCAKTLAETPASLMRPPAPKEGKRILIERSSFYLEASELFLEIVHAKSFPL